MSELLDWNLESDAENIRSSALELERRVKKRLYRPSFETQQKARQALQGTRTVWRRRCLRKAEMFIGNRIHGTVIEIGAGRGWYSSLLSNRQEVDRVFALDYSRYAVEELMPLVQRSLEADTEKFVRVLGSYNEMKVDDAFFDFIISLGALHHSENLMTTLSEGFRVLKPGGFLLASEPCEPNTLSQSEEDQRQNETIARERVVEKYGEDMGPVRKKDNSDHLYRISQYEGLAQTVGFDTWPFVFDATRRTGGTTGLVTRFIRDMALRDKTFRRGGCYSGYRRRVLYPYFAKDVVSLAPVPRVSPTYDDLLLVLQKPRFDVQD